jgi:predicted transcriptional regulator of viral defense system
VLRCDAGRASQRAFLWSKGALCPLEGSAPSNTISGSVKVLFIVINVHYSIATMLEKSRFPPSRARLAAVLQAGRELVSIGTTVSTLGVGRPEAAKLLSRWQSQGWLRRVGRGLYVPVPLELADVGQVVQDPWAIVPPLFGASYIGGWTAAHHWEMTEQLFNETLVFTTKRVIQAHPVASGIRFAVHHVAPVQLFGLVTLWRGRQRVMVSDPARTLVDMLARTDTGGGIDHVAECLVAYLRDPKADRKLLLQYAQKLGNGAVFKRLGFLAASQAGEQLLVEACKNHLTQGYARLDPALACPRLVTAWRLWVPERWGRRRRD